MSSGPSLAAIERLIGAVVRRQRLADAVSGLSRIALPAGLLIAAGAVLLSFTTCGDDNWVAALALVPVPAVLGWAWLRPRSRRGAARLVDRHYQTHDVIGNALEFAEGSTRGTEDPRAEALVHAVIERGVATASKLDPTPAVVMPKLSLRLVDALSAATLAAAVLATLLLPRPQRCLDTAVPAGEAPNALADADAGEPKKGMDMALAEPLREDLQKLKKGEDDAAHVARTISDVLDSLEDGELDRAEAFEELEELETELADAELGFDESLEEDPWKLSDAMRDVAEAFEEHEITEDVAAALERDDPEAAEAALDKAAEEAEKAGGDLKKELDKALEEAEKALRKAANENSKTANRLADEERRLKREEKQAKDAEDKEEAERRLQKQKETVDRLRRQHEREKAAQRELDRLRRKARESQGQSGQQGGKQQQKRKDAQRQLSQGMKGAAQKSKTARRLSQARDSLEEAKTFVRRSGKQGEKENRRKGQQRRFSKAAKGDRKDGKGKDGKDGKDKDGKGKGKGKSTLLVEGEVGDGEPMFMEGENGKDAMGMGQGEGQMEGSMPGDGMGDGSQDPFGDETEMDAKFKNVKVDPSKGKGATRAQVISDSSQEGFASESYKDVYSDYEAFAQSSMDNETLPPSQRRRVKRYFQLIQPRD